MARKSCLDCARKHCAAAEVLMTEAVLGYPLFAWYAVGHLEQAESELIKEFPREAVWVRTERVKYIDGLQFDEVNSDIILNCLYHVDTLAFIEHLTRCSIRLKKSEKKRRK